MGGIVQSAMSVCAVANVGGLKDYRFPQVKLQKEKLCEMSFY